MNRFPAIALTLTFFLGLLSSFAYAQNKSWIEDSFEDFRDGSFAASGIDLYVTKEGTIKSVNRYDLNSDGYLDLVFNSGHDVDFAVPPTLYSTDSDRSDGAFQPLPVDGSKQIKVADLNNDGYQDAVFLPNANGVSSRRFLSILWGSKNGWTNHRKTQFVTISPISMDIADLNGDSWPELIVLNGSRWSPQDGNEPVLRIYWGAKSGYQQNQYKDIVIEHAIDLALRDLDGNGYSELVLLLENRLNVFWNPAQSESPEFSDPQEIDLKTSAVGQLAVTDYTNDGMDDILITGGNQELIRRDPTTGVEEYRYTGVLLLSAEDVKAHQWEDPVSIASPPASDLQVADLNGDGLKDIVLADRTAEDKSIHILWGDEDASSNKNSPVSLPVAYAAAIEIADLDNDSHQDIAVAVHRSKNSYDSSSLIYYGDGNGGFSKANDIIPSAGAEDIHITSTNDNDHTILIANTQSGRFYEDIPVRVYWGGKNGFDLDEMTPLDLRSGYNSAAADLNDDGFTDLVLLSIVHAVKEPHPGIGFNILWGGPDGLKNDRRTILNEYGLYDVSIADINKDGWLDLVGSVGYQNPNRERPPGFVIWYGGADGYSANNSESISSETRPTQHALADFDKDGHLDMALLIGNKHKIAIYWGSEEGFSDENWTEFPFLRGGDMNIADLNGDGWLDIVASSLLIPNSLFYDFGTYVFWGGPDGFDSSNARKLTGHGTVGISISDWDQDGFLDVFLPSYKYTETREAVASHLYWGSSKGFSVSLRTNFLQNSSHGAMAGDFNSDGKLDLAVSNHRSNDNHSTNSRVFYNQDSRFENKKEQLLPTVGSEFIYSDDIGAQYDRSYEKQYTSSVFKWNGSYEKGAIEIQVNKPGKTELQISIRTAESPEALTQTSWKSIGSETSHEFAIPSTDGYLQYRLTFISNNGDRYPEVDKVELSVLSD